MSIKAVLFDLDGTLLPLDQEKFAATYVKTLAGKLAPYGYDPEKLAGSIWSGVKVMMQNDGERLNEEIFWEHFCGIWGEAARKDEPIFEEYYKNEFIAAKTACRFNEKSAETVRLLKQKGYRVILATNPLFPAIATKQRIMWAGLKPEEFELYTTYENSRFCKPNTEYYSDLLKFLDIAPEDAIMVGNDVREDMVARKIGMKVFLLPECLINRDNEDISQFPSGGFDELLEYIYNN